MEIDEFTPEQQKKLDKLGRLYDDGLVGITNELTELDERVERVEDRVADIKDRVANIKDGNDGEDGKDGAKGEKGDKGDDGNDGKDGKDGSPDTGEVIVQKINSLPLEEEVQIDASHIKNLPKTVEKYTRPFTSRLSNLSDVSVSGITTNQSIRWNGTYWEAYTPGGGSGTPGGSDTQVQFNDGGSFGGDAGLTYNKTYDSLYVGSVASILPGTVSRSGGYISSVALTGGRTLTVTRSGNYISSMTDGNKTWTFTRNASNQITSWSVA